MSLSHSHSVEQLSPPADNVSGTVIRSFSLPSPCPYALDTEKEAPLRELLRGVLGVGTKNLDAAQSSYLTPPSTPPESVSSADVQTRFIAPTSELPSLLLTPRQTAPDQKFSTAKPSTGGRERWSLPDRFILPRVASDSLDRPYHVNKHPNSLRTEEQLTRRRSDYANPFSPKRKRPRVIGASPQILRRGMRSIHPPSSIGEPFVLGTPPGPSVPAETVREISLGSVWNVAGRPLVTGPIAAIPNGRGTSFGSGTIAPIYNAEFLDEFQAANQNLDYHEALIAFALEIDQASRVVPTVLIQRSDSSPSPHKFSSTSQIDWRDNEWTQSGMLKPPKAFRKERSRPVPSTPFRVLDAPNLRDDFYCSPLAYCHTSRLVAVGLLSRVYLWSEDHGVQNPPLSSPNLSNYVTSVSFSSTKGGLSILAVARQGGRVSLWSPYDRESRFEVPHPHAVACVSFKQVPTRTPSRRFVGLMVDAEELLVGDELGEVYYYSIEWPTRQECSTHGWRGAVTPLARITVHTQQICGLAWSTDGTHFASGSNDNQCCLFEVKEVVGECTLPTASVMLNGPTEERRHRQFRVQRQSHSFPLSSLFGRHRYCRRSVSDFLAPSSSAGEIITSTSYIDPLLHTRRVIFPGHYGRDSQSGSRSPIKSCKHRWFHRAAVKAIAFCPWQRGLLATGGGSNDRCIHFYHTVSGAKLATINVAAQVTSLIWSSTRREIAATFGYAQPEHPYRIAVFAWPSCEQVVAIPYSGPVGGDMRALYAIAYPGGPNESNGGSEPRGEGEGSGWWGRTREEGCIVVASSDESVKFHEVWSGKGGGGLGVGIGVRGGLGGSDILEGLEGADVEGNEIIR